MSFDMLESIILTKLKYSIDKDINKKYPDLNFVSEPNTAKTKFPNVNVSEMESQATGIDLRNRANGIISSFQITVNTNSNKTDGMEVARDLKRIMISIGYICTSIIYTKQNDIHNCTFRARRTLCDGDTI